MCLAFTFSILTCLGSSESHSGHLKPFGSQGPFLKADEVQEAISTKDFFDKYVNEKISLVFRNEAKRFPAFNLWTDEYLLEKFQKHPESSVNVETEKKESRQQDVVSLDFKEFIENYKKNELYAVTQVPEFLQKDLPLPHVLQCGQASSTVDKSILWFSSGGTKSVTHTDDYENILCVLDGTKKLILIDSYKYADKLNNIIDALEGSYSRMDVDRVDFTVYSDLKHVEYYDVVLKPGDCIYLPLKWIHQVRSYDRSLAVNFWFNYEKIFENKKFSDDCLHHKFDATKTLDNFLAKKPKTTNDEDSYDDFKFFIYRKVNAGYRNITQWITMVSEDLNTSEELVRSIGVDEFIKEIFDMLDYNGDGYLEDEELFNLEFNMLDQLEGLYAEIYRSFQKFYEDNEKSHLREEQNHEEL